MLVADGAIVMVGGLDGLTQHTPRALYVALLSYRTVYMVRSLYIARATYGIHRVLIIF